MDRACLDKMSTERLKKKAIKCGLAPSSDRSKIIDALMTYQERSGDVGPLEGSEASVEDLAQRQDPVVPPETQIDRLVSTEAIHEALTLMTATMEQNQKMMRQQHQQLAQLTQLLLTRAAPAPVVPKAAAIIASGDSHGSLTGTTSVSPQASGTSPLRRTMEHGQPTGNRVSWLATQISEFGGAEEENVQSWVKRVDKVAEVHGASDGVTLLAASSRLVKSARRWYELQDGQILESWINLRTELLKMFTRKVPFHKAMQ